MHTSRAVSLAASSLLLLTGLSACQLGSDEEVQKVLDDLVAGLESGDLSGVPTDGADATAAYEKATAALPVEPQVKTGEPSTDGDKATATLTWTWTPVLGQQAWTYDSEVDLERRDDAWVVTWDPALVHPQLAEGRDLQLDHVPAERGEILGAGDVALVTERDVLRLGLDKTKVPAAQVAASAQAIATALGIDAAAYVKRAQSAGAKAFVEGLVVRADHPEQHHLSATWKTIPGAVAIGAQRPLAPTREFAAPILGSVGEATAEIVEKSKGRVRPGETVGRSGLQARYDERLGGKDGYVVKVIDDQGSSTVLTTVAPVAGQPLRTTLDLDTQLKAERVLAGVQGAGAIVAIQPSTGRVLAAAAAPGSDGADVAAFGRYAPGSTFKVVTALALLRAGLTPTSPLECPATTVVDGKTFKNYDDYPAGSLGTITLREAIAQSCNTALIGAADRLGPQALTEAAAALGLGVDHDLGLPAYFGQVPPPAGETEKAADLIGQGKVQASPLAMAAVAASVQAGKAVLPQLLPDHKVEQKAPAKPLTPQEAAQLQELMRAVVTEGSGQVLAPLGDVRAKTGTAEFGMPDASGRLATHAWMIATRGDLAVAVFVENGESGSRTAGPLLRAFLQG